MLYQKYNFENLEIYELSLSIVEKIYSLAKSFPNEEVFALTSQIKRAAVSIVLNIAEGSGRNSKKDFSKFVSQAIGSLFEVKACLHIASKLKYIKQSEIDEMIRKLDGFFLSQSLLRNLLCEI